MNIWLKGNERCCDRNTAVNLCGKEYADKSRKTIYYFDEFITIVDDEEEIKKATENNSKELTR